MGHIQHAWRPRDNAIHVGSTPKNSSPSGITVSYRRHSKKLASCEAKRNDRDRDFNRVGTLEKRLLKRWCNHRLSSVVSSGHFQTNISSMPCYSPHTICFEILEILDSLLSRFRLWHSLRIVYENPPVHTHSSRVLRGRNVVRQSTVGEIQTAQRQPAQST